MIDEASIPEHQELLPPTEAGAGTCGEDYAPDVPTSKAASRRVAIVRHAKGGYGRDSIHSLTVTLAEPELRGQHVRVVLLHGDMAAMVRRR
jgi:hypothetical protein